MTLWPKLLHDADLLFSEKMTSGGAKSLSKQNQATEKDF